MTISTIVTNLNSVTTDQIKKASLMAYSLQDRDAGKLEELYEQGQCRASKN